MSQTGVLTPTLMRARKLDLLRLTIDCMVVLHGADVGLFCLNMWECSEALVVWTAPY